MTKCAFKNYNTVEFNYKKKKNNNLCSFTDKNWEVIIMSVQKCDHNI